MVFGSHTSNPTHWKRLALREEDERKLREGFTKAVVAQTGFTEEQWAKYWEQIVTFRNKYVVHRDNFKDVVPNFDKALEVAYAYDRWIKNFPRYLGRATPERISRESEKRSELFYRELCTTSKGPGLESESCDAFERHGAGDATVIPVVIRDVAWKCIILERTPKMTTRTVPDRPVQSPMSGGEHASAACATPRSVLIFCAVRYASTIPQIQGIGVVIIPTTSHSIHHDMP